MPSNLGLSRIALKLYFLFLAITMPAAAMDAGIRHNAIPVLILSSLFPPWVLFSAAVVPEASAEVVAEASAEVVTEASAEVVTGASLTGIARVSSLPQTEQTLFSLPSSSSVGSFTVSQSP